MTEITHCLQQLTATNAAEVQDRLAAMVNHLLLTDFSALVEVLYKVDVPEEKLKKALAQNKETDAGEIIAKLLISRQQQKQQHRGQSPYTASDEEAW